jgi:hypothetical protein
VLCGNRRLSAVLRPGVMPRFDSVPGKPELLRATKFVGNGSNFAFAPIYEPIECVSRFDARSARGPPHLFNALWDTSLRSA